MSARKVHATLGTIILTAMAFAAGRFWVGDATPPERRQAPTPPTPTKQAPPDRREPRAASRPAPTRVAGLLEAGRLEAAVDAHNALDGPAEAKERARRRILETARSLADAGRRDRAIALLQAFTHINHRDLEALMMLAELHRARGDSGAALDVLLRAADAAHVGYTRERADKVEAFMRATFRERATALSKRSDREGVIALYRKLIGKGYGRPKDRLTLAMHLKQAGRLRAAKRALAVIREVPAVAEQADRLARRIERERAGEQRQAPSRQQQRGHRIELKRRGANFTVRAVTGDGPGLELLVDTGASLVAVTRSAARRSGLDQAESLGRRRLQTADGVVEARIVRAERLRIGTLEVRQIPVAILPRSLDGIDGLLGMNALRGYDVRLDRGARELALVPQ